VTILGCFRVIERLGKSFRGPPRAACLSAIAAEKTEDIRSAYKALDQAGAVLGPLVAYALLSCQGEKVSFPFRRGPMSRQFGGPHHGRSPT
jgi:hypothetical protein